MGFLDKLKITKLTLAADKAVKNQEFEKALAYYAEIIALKWTDEADNSSLALLSTIPIQKTIITPLRIWKPRSS